MILAANLLAFVLSAAGFVYGAMRFFKKKVALFNQMAVCAVGCFMFARLYCVVEYLCRRTQATGFNVSYIGMLGGFMFMFSASYGQMNGLVDGGEKENFKYRLISALAPVAVMAMIALVLTSNAVFGVKFIFVLVLAAIALSSYYNLKFILIPDVDMGILKSIRGYNLVALILCVFSAGELVFTAIGNDVGMYGCMLVSAVMTLILVPVLSKGSRRWTL